MIIDQRHPQLLLKLHEVLGEGIRATGQASVTLALREVIAFDKARVHRLTDWRGRHTCRHKPRQHILSTSAELTGS
jgi:ABC-type Fe2+-enterobactin transport system substrate-binding protein